MNCIIIDDEPLAREATQMLIDQTENLNLIGSFNSPEAAKNFIEDNTIELIFLDIEMPGINGIDFAQSIPKETFVVFITAYSDFATDSYEVDAIDYLMKPVKLERFKKAVEKVENYSKLLQAGYVNNDIKKVTDDFFYVKADRKIFKLYFDNIFFIQGLKDYVVMHTDNQRVITAMNIKTIQDQLPKDIFVRVSKSYIINVKHIDAVDNNTVYIGTNEIPIGNIYRDFFFNEFVTKKILTK